MPEPRAARLRLHTPREVIARLAGFALSGAGSLALSVGLCTLDCRWATGSAWIDGPGNPAP